jgi:hypothetical protein
MCGTLLHSHVSDAMPSGTCFGEISCISLGKGHLSRVSTNRYTTKHVFDECKEKILGKDLTGKLPPVLIFGWVKNHIFAERPFLDARQRMMTSVCSSDAEEQPCDS